MRCFSCHKFLHKVRCPKERWDLPCGAAVNTDTVAQGQDSRFRRVALNNQQSKVPDHRPRDELELPIYIPASFSSRNNDLKLL